MRRSPRLASTGSSEWLREAPCILHRGWREQRQECLCCSRQVGVADTKRRLSVAGGRPGTHTFHMTVPGHRLGLALVASIVLFCAASRADEIRLKDGKKLYGVIVAYEDNMFKVKTDFGYVLVEKDKIESIIPDTPTSATPTKAEAATKPAASEPKVAGNSEITASKKERNTAVTVNANSRPGIPMTTKAVSDADAPALKPAATPRASLLPTTGPPPPAKPGPSEEIQGNLYTNHEYGFRMYKAPSWQLIDGAGQALPNAIVAMGTSNESTLLVVGHETARASLDSAAQATEKRLHEVYENYRLISQRKTVVGGQPAFEYRYRGMADGHDWSGTLAVVAHGGEMLTILGMTFADTDLIQIQENVIARSIASVDFRVN